MPIYVGQTANMNERKRSYYRLIEKDKLPESGRFYNIKGYLVRLNRLGYKPIFEVVDEQPTEEKSLESETNWVKKTVEDGFPLLNNWRIHKEIIYQKFPRKKVKAYFIERVDDKYAVAQKQTDNQRSFPF